MALFLNNELDSQLRINEHCLDALKCKQMLSERRNDFTVVLQNIRSINKNFDEFLATIDFLNFKPDCIVLTEAHLNEYSCNELYHIPNYNIVTTAKIINKNSGIAVFVNKKHTIISTQEFQIHHTNCLKIHIKVNNKIIQLYAVYRTHGSEPLHFIHEFQEIITKYKHNMIIVAGDFNIDINNQYNNLIKDEYLNTMTEMNLVSCINASTRVFAGQTPSCIDHIWTNFKEADNVQSIICKTDITDHYTCILLLQLYNQSQENKKTTIHNHDKYDYINIDKVRQKIEEENWSSVLQIEDPKICATNFETTVDSIIKYSTEIKTHKQVSKYKKLKPWITNAILTSIRKKEKLYKCTKKNPQDKSIQIFYKKYKNKLISIIKKNKENYYITRFNEAGLDSKRVWNVVKTIFHKNKSKQNTIEKINCDGDIVDGDLEPVKCANIFNDYFSNIGKVLAYNIDPDYERDTINEENSVQLSTATSSLSEFKQVDEKKVIKIINELRTSASPGFDNVTVKLLKLFSTNFAKPITHLINTSLKCGIFPPNYKKTIITPIYKSGERMEISNYRPISLVSNVAKIYEKVVKEQLINYVNENALLNDNQFGFRQGLSTQDAIAKLTTTVYNALDEKEKCLGIYIDLKKAFDSISHIKLISKLQSIGLTSNVLSWFRSYLSNRCQQVKINNKTSHATSTNFGIPQGTVIGPILFILYINDMFNLPLKGQIISYADDTVIVLTDKTWDEINKNANMDLKIIKDWFDKNYLTMNTGKTFFMTYIMNKKMIPHNLNIRVHKKNCENLYNCDECDVLISKEKLKYLGIVMDQEIKWKDQIEEIVKRIRKLFHIFITLRNVVDLNKMKMIYFALAQSVIQYGIVGWGGTFQVHLSPMEIAQKKLLKILYKKPRDYPTEKLFKELKILTTKQIYEKNSILQIYKSKNTFQVSLRPRTKGSIEIKKFNTSTAQHHYIYHGTKLFNALPVDVKLENCYEKFKKYIKGKYTPT